MSADFCEKGTYLRKSEKGDALIFHGNARKGDALIFSTYA